MEIHGPSSCLSILLYLLASMAPSASAVLQNECPPTPPPGSTHFIEFVPHGPSDLQKRFVRRKDLRNDGTNSDFVFGVGKKGGIQYTVCIYEDDRRACEAPLTDFSVTLDPPGALFSDSSYTLNSGSITDIASQPQNPFHFVPRFPGHITLEVGGTACELNWKFKDPYKLEVKGADIQLKADKTSCPTQPEIYAELLLWATSAQPDGCQIRFSVTNNLERPASFGVVNTLLSANSYLLIDGHWTPFVRTDLNVLDANPDKNAKGGYALAYPTSDGELKPGATTDLTFTDSPFVTLGKGCWTAASGKTGRYTHIAFRHLFVTSVMQDWDKVNDPDVNQVPIGGDAVVRWEILAQANLDGNQWTVDNTVSQLVQPPASYGVPPDWTPNWSGYIQSGNFDTATFNENTGCYDFAQDPV